jgi:hypothetical protein
MWRPVSTKEAGFLFIDSASNLSAFGSFNNLASWFVIFSSLILKI